MTDIEIAGVDLSLTSTGIARVCWTPGDYRFPDSPLLMYPFTRRIESKGQAKASLAQRHSRLDRLAQIVCDEVGGARLVVVEGPSLGQARQGGQHDRAGLWWLVVSALLAEHVTVVEVSPASRSKYATGVGNAAKDRVLAAVIKRYPIFDVTGNDVADAVVLSAMGARHLGHPIEMSLPATHLAAMAGVAWPTNLPGGKAL